MENCWEPKHLRLGSTLNEGSWYSSFLLTYIGPSSNISFTRHVTNLLASKRNIVNPLPSIASQGLWVPSQEGHQFSETSRAQAQIPRSCGLDTTDPFSMPPEHIVDRLIKRYFKVTNALFPFLHKPSFLDTYGLMKQRGKQACRRSWLGLLNMILALSTMHEACRDSSNGAWEAEARKYYDRAKLLCDTTTLSGTSLEVGKFSWRLSRVRS